MLKKVCITCMQRKNLNDFPKRKNSKDGYRNECKKCKNNKSRKRYQNKDVMKYHKDYRLKNKKSIAIYHKNYYINKNHNLKKLLNVKSLYNNYFDKLTIDEQPRLAKDGVLLEVKCRYCGKYFIPTNRQVRNRISSLNSDDGRERSLYCSDGCKKACPVFNQIFYPKNFKQGTSREVQAQLRQMVLKRDNYTCQKCGKTIDDIELHCHHIWPLNESPITSADVDECITLCKECHKLKHKIPDCGYHELKCI